MAAANRIEVLKVDIDSLWEAITDYESYPDFVSGCESAEIVKQGKNSKLVEYTVNKIKRIQYTLEHKETPKKKVVWKMKEGEFFKSNDGSWELKDLGDGKVEVNYSVDVGLPALVPKAIVKGLVSNGLPEMIEEFHKRAKKLAKKAKK